MSQNLFFATISGGLYLIGFLPYIYHVLRGKVIPHPFTWTIWFLFAMLNFSILFFSAGWTWSLISVGLRVGALLLSMIAGWYLIRKVPISRSDVFLFIGAILLFGIMLFMDTSYAVITMVIIDMSILIPTIRKIWDDPQSEDSLVWFTTGFSLSCLLISLPFFTFENSFFWVYSICANLFIGIFIRIRKLYGPRTIRMQIYTFMSYVNGKVEQIFALKNKL